MASSSQDEAMLLAAYPAKTMTAPAMPVAVRRSGVTQDGIRRHSQSSSRRSLAASQFCWIRESDGGDWGWIVIGLRSWSGTAGASGERQARYMPASTAASEDAPAKENRRDDRCRQCSPKGKPVLLHDMLPYAREHSSLSVGSCGKKTRWAFLPAFMRAEQNFPDPGRFSASRKIGRASCRARVCKYM